MDKELIESITRISNLTKMYSYENLAAVKAMQEAEKVLTVASKAVRESMRFAQDYAKNLEIATRALKQNAMYLETIKSSLMIQDVVANLVNSFGAYRHWLDDTIFTALPNTEIIDEEFTEKVVQDTVSVVENVSTEESLSNLEKRNYLSKLWRFLKKLKLFPLIFAFIFNHAFDKVADYTYDNYIQPAIYEREFEELKEENVGLNLRMIKRNTPLYRGKKMKSILTILEEYEIVIVLEEYKEKVKVQIYGSDEIGWIYKKYSKK